MRVAIGLVLALVGTALGSIIGGGIGFAISFLVLQSENAKGPGAGIMVVIFCVAGFFLGTLGGAMLSGRLFQKFVAKDSVKKAAESFPTPLLPDEVWPPPPQQPL